MKNNKGFVLIETIIVVSILTIGLLSLYASYILIIRKASNANIPDPTNSYIAYQIGTKTMVSADYHITNKAYTEVFFLGDHCLVREVTTGGDPGSSNSCTSEVEKLLTNLDVEKVYYITINFSNLFNKPLLLSFDGSTIDYLNSIKNNGDINMTALQTVVVKTNKDDKVQFSFYQSVTEAEKDTLRRSIINSAGGTIVSATTPPGSSIYTSNSNTLAAAMDDYGLSYYFRGKVNNNYIQFAGMCWRIVRITGNGAIKIVLYNGDDESCNAGAIGDLKAFAKLDTTTPELHKFNPASNVMTYVGFMYGNYYPSATNLIEIRQNNADSVVLDFLKSWYDAKFDYNAQQLIADVIYCNDMSFSSTFNGLPNADFKGFERIETNKVASLICPTINGQEQVSRFTSSSDIIGNGDLHGYKIGLLTADEVAFAGGMYNTTNTQNYLYTNAKGWYWTMTPDIYRGTAYMYAVNGSGALYYRKTDSTAYIRPVIALNPSIEVTGEGTIESPYIVTI